MNQNKTKTRIALIGGSFEAQNGFIERGTIIFEGNKILSAGKSADVEITDYSKIIDVSERKVYPYSESRIIITETGIKLKGNISTVDENANEILVGENADLLIITKDGTIETILNNGEVSYQKIG